MWLSPTSQSLAPRLLAPGEPMERSNLARLSEEDWRRLTERFVEHRVAALAHWCAQERGDLDRLPATVAERWSEDRTAHTLRSLHLQRRLVELARLFADEQFEAVALKGAFLAFFAYPEPALRPMRDLDFAFADKREAVKAWSLLREADYTLYQPFEGDPLALLEERHQLPTLIAPDGEVAVEVQHRLFHAGDKDPAFVPAFWAEVREEMLLGTAVRFPATHWLALHIVVHGVRDHRFDSGPNVVADIAMLERAGAMDVEAVSRLAKDWDASEEWELVHALVDTQWKGEATGNDAPALRDAWSIMLAPPEQVVAARQRNRVIGAERAGLLRKLFPSRTLLEGRYGATGRLGLIGHFARHYVNLLARRLPALSRSADPQVGAAMRRLDARLRGDDVDEQVTVPPTIG